MDKPIQVGDMVQLVRQPCCGSEIGKVFQVSELAISSHGFYCSDCKTIWGQHYRARVTHQGWKFPVAWLKRIPPLSDDERENEKLDLEEAERFSRLIKENA